MEGKGMEDLRDFPGVSLAEARDAADALGLRAEMDTAAGKEARPGDQYAYRDAFIFNLLCHINAAFRSGTNWEDLPDEVRAFYHHAVDNEGSDVPSRWECPDYVQDIKNHPGTGGEE